MHELKLEMRYKYPQTIIETIESVDKIFCYRNDKLSHLTSKDIFEKAKIKESLDALNLFLEEQIKE